MARPIKETPILVGEDARKFTEIIEKNKSKKISADEYKKAMDSYRRFEIIDTIKN